MGPKKLWEQQVSEKLKKRQKIDIFYKFCLYLHISSHFHKENLVKKTFIHVKNCKEFEKMGPKKLCGLHV